MLQKRTDYKDWIYNRDDYAVCEFKNKLNLSINNVKVVCKRGDKYILPDMMYNHDSLKPYIKSSYDKFKNIYRPYYGEDLNNKTILVARAGGIGDVIYMSAAMKALKKKYPNCKIVFSCSDSYKSMIDNMDFYDKYIKYPFTLNRFALADYHALYSGIVERTTDSYNTNLYELSAKFIGLDDVGLEDLNPSIKVSPDKLIFCKDLLKQWNVDKFVLVQKHASAINRTPPDKIWKPILKYISSLGLSIIFIDSPNREKDVDLSMKYFELDNTFNLCGYSKTLDISIAMQSLSVFNLCADTSMIPISHSIGAKVLSIHGPFLGNLRTNYGDNHQYINAETSCSPCFLNGNERCKNGQKCFLELDINRVIEKIDYLIGEPK